MSGTAVWPWLALVGLGAYHGLNPAMGWLFAVAIGLQERRRAAVLQALPPIALGHEASVALVVVSSRRARIAWVARAAWCSSPRVRAARARAKAAPTWRR